MSAPTFDPGMSSRGTGHAVVTADLTKRFGREVALQRVNLLVPNGSVYLLAGNNGAGKSSLLRILLNLDTPDEGRAKVLGLDPRSDGPQVRALTGYVPEGADGTYRWMRVGQMFDHQARFYSKWDRHFTEHLIRTLGVRLDRRIGHLSKGHLRRVQIVSALARRPDLLLLDEITNGLDPLVRDEVLGLLAGYVAETGCTAIISTHLVSEVERLVDHVGVLHSGRLLVQESTERLLEHLCRYDLSLPDSWSPTEALKPMIVQRQAGMGRATSLVLHGAADKAAAAIAASGAAVRNVSRLPLDKAVLILLQRDSRDEPSR